MYFTIWSQNVISNLVFYYLFNYFIVIFVAGDKESGKTTMIAKLQGNEDPKKGSGLEYGYIDVRDEYREGRFVVVYSKADHENIF